MKASRPTARSARALRDDWLQRLVIIDPDHLAALDAIRALPDPIVPEKARGALEALAKLLLLAATQLTRLFNQHGECDHVEIAGAARRALTEDSSPTPLAERIGTRLMHILVDEFQDTSRDQYDLLRTLTQDWSPGDGRTLFLVGDPMQSIYGFRNAEVGRFSTVRAAGLDGLPLTTLELRRNFRSAPALVHWCNDVFSRVFPAADDVRKSAVRHLASVAARTNLERRAAHLSRGGRLRPASRGRTRRGSDRRIETHAAGRIHRRACGRASASARHSRKPGKARGAVHRREARAAGGCRRGARPRSAGARHRLAARPGGMAGSASRAVRRAWRLPISPWSAKPRARARSCRR